MRSRPVFVSSRVAAEVFCWHDAIAALQAAYRVASSEKANPPRTVAMSPDAWLRTLPAMPPASRYFGAKLMGVSLGAEQPAVEYVTVLFDRVSSRIAAFVDGAQVTAFRTAATSAAAVDKLAPAGPLRLGVLGSGLEASMHTRAIATIRPLTEIVVYSPTPSRREQFADTLGRELSVPTRAVDEPRAATAHASIVLTAARSRGEVPVLVGDWIRGGALVVSIGSTIPQQRELDVSVIARACIIVCDRMQEVMSETGDMLAARSACIDFTPRCRSLQSIMADDWTVPATTEEILLYKSVGSGLQDIVVAELVLEAAIRAGKATPLPIEFESKSL